LKTTYQFGLNGFKYAQYVRKKYFTDKNLSIKIKILESYWNLIGGEIFLKTKNLNFFLISYSFGILISIVVLVIELFYKKKVLNEEFILFLRKR